MRSCRVTLSPVRRPSALMVSGAHGAIGRLPQSVATLGTFGGSGQSPHIRQHAERLWLDLRMSLNYLTLVSVAKFQATACSMSGESGPIVTAPAMATLSALAPSPSMQLRVEKRASVISRRQRAATRAQLEAHGMFLLKDARVLLQSHHASTHPGQNGPHAAEHAMVAMRPGTAPL